MQQPFPPEAEQQHYCLTWPPGVFLDEVYLLFFSWLLFYSSVGQFAEGMVVVGHNITDTQVKVGAQG